MSEKSSEEKTLSQEVLVLELVNRIEGIIKDAEANTRPLEVDPYRGNLFEVFVLADGAGLLTERTPNMTSESITKILAGRWKLKEVAELAGQQKAAFSTDDLRKMQLLWSILRMWMEWSYAWGRWAEFHDKDKVSN